MKDGLGDLLPSRAFSKRMLELEAELKRARAFQRRHSKSPDTLGRWGLDTPAEPHQEESWFITYLDMMTLLLVVMIVMLAFSGNLNWQDASTVQLDAPAPITEAMPPSPETPSTVPAEDAPMQPDGAMPPKGGEGLLPAGNGLLPGVAHPTAEPVSPFEHPADAGPLPRASHALAASDDASSSIPVPERVVSITELYPGWGSRDLAASFIGPPRPPASEVAVATQEAAADPAAVADEGAVNAEAPSTGEAPATEETPATAEAPAAEEAISSEGEDVAAGLSLDELGNDVQVVVNERSVSFRVNSEILFDSSQADLSRSGLAVLRQIVGVLSDTNHEITVEGHTDAVPVRRNVRYPSNWELSSARAGSVVRYLQANGIDRSRLKAVGYADTRPIDDNHTPQGRANNRRVELLIEKRD